jgi:hypothetical protein
MEIKKKFIKKSIKKLPVPKELAVQIITLLCWKDGRTLWRELANGRTGQGKNIR